MQQVRIPCRGLSVAGWVALGLLLGAPAAAQAPRVVGSQRNNVTLELAAPSTVVALAVSDDGDVLLLNASDLAAALPRTGQAAVQLDYTRGVWLRGGPRLKAPATSGTQLNCPNQADDEYRRHIITPQLAEDKPTPAPPSRGCQWLVGPDGSRVVWPIMRHLIVAVTEGGIDPFPLDSALAHLDLRGPVRSESVASAIASGLGAAGQGREWWTWARSTRVSLRDSKTMVSCGWEWVGDCPHSGPVIR
ncbi:MAG: hypothetical protein R2882_09810 [Gemmatimonadales bacterium]